MNQLYAPWRGDYTASTARTKHENSHADDCVFCTQFAEKKDAQHLIIRRFNHCIVMLNKYPYNAGHLLILPEAHIANLNDLSQEVRYELMDLTNFSVEAVKTTFGAEGVNVGLNLGKAAGAGIPSHLHMHILPRWIGDTNFMPTLTETKTISFDLNQLYERIKPAFDAYSI